LPGSFFSPYSPPH